MHPTAEIRPDPPKILQKKSGTIQPIIISLVYRLLLVLAGGTMLLSGSS
jgi:hypothetical protein